MDGLYANILHPSGDLSDGDSVKQITAAFRTLGCKLNQCDTAQMQQILSDAGYTLVGWDQPADLRVINTCTVTAKTDRTCRREIRLAKRIDPDCLLVVTGCYAQISPEVLAAIPGVDLVLGNNEKLELARHVGGAGPAGGACAPITVVSDYPGSVAFSQEFISHFHGYTRAFLKIQTGCDSYCAYCIIPIARGPARSMLQSRVLEQVDMLIERGFREIVFTGINLGSWGRDTGEGRLSDLIASLTTPSELQDTGRPSVRYRISSIEPLEVDERLLDVVEQAGEHVAHHFHLPLQSGSTSVLRRMNRPYDPETYARIVEEVARRFPDAAIGADVIVGFPGETDAESEETVSFIEGLPLTYLHVFSYSDRPGTVASAMQDKICPEVIHERGLRLRRLGETKRRGFFQKALNAHRKALVLQERSKDGHLIGLTGDYMEVALTGDDSLMNRFVQVRLDRLRSDRRWEGTIVATEDGP